MYRNEGEEGISGDFKRLREKYERHLIAGKRVGFILCLEDGQAKYDTKITEG
jgi:hypothetical protein